jgi:hypothetical protein
MKSRNDFETLDQFREHLRNYWAGALLSPMLPQPNVSSVRKAVEIAAEAAEELVKKLYP